MKSGRLINFRLEKLYLDCIDDQGNCFIIYRAELRSFFININYSSLIFSDYTDVTTEKASLKKTVRPESSEHLNFDHKNLHVSGSWRSIDSPLPPFCFTDTLNHELVWNCHHPKARTVIVYNGNTFSGYGYGETLFLTIKPWNLPFDELRWGRFLSGENAITWLNWKGSYPVNKLFCNGIEYHDGQFEEDKIIFDNGSCVLTFNEISVIRKGKLTNLLSGMTWLKIFFTRRILNTLEIKYKAKSTFSQNRVILTGGWSLYEIVSWEK